MKRLPQTSGGAALIVVLSSIAILSVLLVTFLMAMRLERQSTSSYTQTLRAQEIARGGLQEIVDDLIKEIDAGSVSDSVYTQNSIRVYTPLTNFTAQPARIGYASTAMARTVDGTHIPSTLIRVSRAVDSFYTTPPTYYDSTKLPMNRASAVSTSTSSINGRRITADRWNKPLLLGTSVPTVFSSTPPDWVYLTRNGSRSLTTANLPAIKPDSTGTNLTTVIGRYAYVIYDEAALLDVNVAGYPAKSVSNTDVSVAGKSYLSYADLTAIPGITADIAEALVNWRNKAGIAQASSYTNFVSIAAINGFLLATSSGAASDNPLLSRQDLLDYFRTQGWNMSALAYLGTFSRAVNAPSWHPTKSTPKANYVAHANDITMANRDLANVRKLDGTSLITKRFPLSRLGLITHSATSAKNESDSIYKYFGLYRASADKSWTYDHGNPNNILTMDQIRIIDRDPDFFELLKAAILNGSMGLDPGAAPPLLNGWATTLQGPAGAGFEKYSAYTDAQIIQIGVNIIDLCRADNYPTAIHFLAQTENSSVPEQILFNTFFGVKNLPYLSRILSITYEATPNQLGGWLQPELWNPHQKASRTVPGPTNFRVRAYGGAHTFWWQSYTPKNGSPTGMGGASAPQYYSGASSANALIVFSDSGDTFRDHPLALTTSLILSSQTPICNFRQPGFTADVPNNQFVGIFTGYVPYTPHRVASDSTGEYKGPSAAIIPHSQVTFCLEYQDTSGWHPYNLLSRLTIPDQNSFSPVGASGSSLGICFYIRPDPRTDRFSVSENYDGTFNGDTTRFPNNTTFRPSNGTEYFVWKYFPSGASFSYSPQASATSAGLNNLKLAQWAENMTGGSYYTDPDGVVRKGDGFRRSASTGDGCPTYIGSPTAARRPVILNRPFQSVGELGYVFRDLPYKTLDFWSTDSADAALLDIFCLEEEPAVVAGQININNAPVPVIGAILSGGAKGEYAPSYRNTSETLTLSQVIANFIDTPSNGPISNRADLAVSLADTINSALPASIDKANKSIAESPVRALSPVMNTRTWNLMIDVIAQSGRITTTASALSDFVVEGERRYWFHVAIDRYTGKIVAQQLEPVFE